MQSVDRGGARFLHTTFVSVSNTHNRRGSLRRWLLSSIGSTALVAAIFTGFGGPARADDEIQVYNAEIADEGEWTFQHHFNYAIQGRTDPDFPGGLVPNHTLNATPEFAYGVTPWFEFGFYVPWAIDKNGYESDGAKLRTLFVTPDAKNREFFYGINFEYDYFMPKFEQTRFGMEIRPIIGWHFSDYEFIVNPIVDVGFGSQGEVTFNPAMRFARNWGEDFALAVEYYSGFGPIGDFLPLNQQQHNIWGVVDFKVGRWDVETGIGYGLTNPGSDRWITKLMITTNLFDSPEEESKSAGMKKMGMVTKAPKKKAAESKSAPVVVYNFTGCYAGDYVGGSFAPDIQTTDPRSAGGAIPAGTFFDAPNVTDGGYYRVPFKEFVTGGGTLGCVREDMRSGFTYGAEGEAGFMRLHAWAIDPYSTLFPDHTGVLDNAVIGDWYGAVAGRAGWAAARTLFYGKVGVGFTDLSSTITTFCFTAPCGNRSLNAGYSSTRAFWVAGGGIEWAWTGNWTLKMEYLYLGLNDTYAVCGPGAVGGLGANFCANHTLEGVHTTKLGFNYKFSSGWLPGF
jgi:opacity protein-like surface antigen